MYGKDKVHLKKIKNASVMRKTGNKLKRSMPQLRDRLEKVEAINASARRQTVRKLKCIQKNQYWRMQ